MISKEAEPRPRIVDKVLDFEPISNTIDLAVNTAIAVETFTRKIFEKRESK